MKLKMKLLNQKNREVLTNLEANSIDSVVTDPPYGWSFMGKGWDYDVPSKSLWELVYHVLKPGGHMLVCCGTRTQHRMVVNIEDAGFEIRDVVVWIHGEGFPKSTKLGDGWGTALKPAAELWTLCRKPISEQTVVENMAEHGTGGINIDESRIGLEKRTYKGAGDSPIKTSARQKGDTGVGMLDGSGSDKEFTATGRWPANVILGHHVDCVKLGEKKIKPPGGSSGRPADTGTFNFGEHEQKSHPWRNENNEETIEDWNCSDDCPVKIMDGQSGDTKSGIERGERGTGGIWTGISNRPIGPQYGDEGGASRFFKQVAPDKYDCHDDCPIKIMDDQTKDKMHGAGKLRESNRHGEFKGSFPAQGSGGHRFGDEGGASRFFYQAKAGNNERYFWCPVCERVGDRKKDHRGHEKELIFHPTQKPLQLMEYLVKMITPPKGIVLDPYMGSGTTMVAAKLHGFDYVGIEDNEHYFKFAEWRIKNTSYTNLEDFFND